jgi:serine/threonine-protein kinase HipA
MANCGLPKAAGSSVCPGRFRNITRDDLLAVADRYQIARATRMLSDVKEAVSAWPDFARQAGVSKPDTDRVRADHSLL